MNEYIGNINSCMYLLLPVTILHENISINPADIGQTIIVTGYLLNSDESLHYTDCAVLLETLTIHKI